MLKKHPGFAGIQGPILTVIMDGVGVNNSAVGNAVLHANTPTLDRLFRDYPHTTLLAHGKAVGMPSDADMGNSEVGHNALGAGQVFNQGAALVSDAIATGSLFEGQAWREIIANVKERASTSNSRIARRWGEASIARRIHAGRSGSVSSMYSIRVPDPSV